MRLIVIHEAVRLSIELDAAAAQVHSDVEKHPWGWLFHNAGNPNHHNSNTARLIQASDPDRAIGYIIDFYRKRQLTPRVRVDNLTMPSDFATRLEARGFVVDYSALRVMTWTDFAPSLQTTAPDITIRRAGEADLGEVTRVQAEGFGNETTDWLEGSLRFELAHPQIRCYLAQLDGVAAASVTVFDGQEWGLVTNVATTPNYRQRGLATALMRQAQAESKMPLLLEVAEDNAQRVYERVGFRVQGELYQSSCWLPDEDV
jgi:ribosomal protein S18 acetylase RimI-like enzyme